MVRNPAAKRWGFILIAICVFSLVLILPLSSNASESGKFNGSWIANGTRTRFPFDPNRRIYTFTLGGHVNLKTNLGKKKDYWSDCVGLSDSATGIVARCVWKDLDGTEIYLTLQGEKWQEETPFTGVIVGGSRTLQGIVGELSFTWSSFIVQQDAAGSTASGQTLDLHGSYHIP